MDPHDYHQPLLSEVKAEDALSDDDSPSPVEAYNSLLPQGKKSLYVDIILDEKFNDTYSKEAILIDFINDFYVPFEYEVEQNNYAEVLTQVNNVLNKIKEHNESHYHFFLNTLLRMFAANNLDVFMLLYENLLEVAARHANDANEEFKKMYSDVMRIADFIFLNQSLTSERRLDVKTRNYVLLESTALLFTALSVGTAPVVQKLMNMRANAMDPVPILLKGGVTLAEKSASAVRNYHNLKRRAKAESRGIGSYIQKYVKKNKLKIAAGILLFGGAAAASFLFPPVGMALMIAMTAWTGVSIFRLIGARMQKYRESKKILKQQERDVNNLIAAEESSDSRDEVSAGARKTPLDPDDEVASINSSSRKVVLPPSQYSPRQFSSSPPAGIVVNQPVPTTRPKTR